MRTNPFKDSWLKVNKNLGFPMPSSKNWSMNSMNIGSKYPEVSRNLNSSEEKYKDLSNKIKVSMDSWKELNKPFACLPLNKVSSWQS